jgi:hypothetical protein
MSPDAGPCGAGVSSLTSLHTAGHRSARITSEVLAFWNATTVPLSRSSGDWRSEVKEETPAVRPASGDMNGAGHPAASAARADEHSASVQRGFRNRTRHFVNSSLGWYETLLRRNPAIPMSCSKFSHCTGRGKARQKCWNMNG